MNSKKRHFVDCHLTTIKFSPKHLLPLVTLYESITSGVRLDALQVRSKSHDTYAGFEQVKMRWFFADTRRSMEVFRNVVDSSNLRIARSIVGSNSHCVRVVHASIIVIEGSYPTGQWHADFTDPLLTPGRSATLLTPLFPFQRNFGGLEVSGAKRGAGLDYGEFSCVYRYKMGEAILFDGTAMVHRTQGYRARPTAKRVLVCWQIADTSKDMLPAFRRIGLNNGDKMFLNKH